MSANGNPPEIKNKKLGCIMFADDVLILSQSQEGMQNSLDALAEYSDAWKLTVNLSKTKLMIFNKRNQIVKHKSVFYKGNEIDVVGSYNYLLIVFTSNGKFKLACKTLKEKAMKAMFLLKPQSLNCAKTNKQTLNFISNLKISTALNLFDKLIAPIISYGCEVWGEEVIKNSDIIENVNYSFCRLLLEVKKNATKLANLRGIGKMPSCHKN
ncbi:uncharacterized protein LOC144345240 [Saccoglossus kowalevskii]